MRKREKKDSRKEKEPLITEEEILNICYKIIPPVFIIWFIARILKIFMDYGVITF